MEKKKLIPIIISAASAVVVLGIIILLMVAGNHARLEKPTGLMVVETQNQKLVCVDSSNDVMQYRFTITPQGETNSQVASIFTHQFDASSYLKKPGEYTISCQYIGKEEFNISPAQEISYISKHKVAAPNLNLNDNILNVELFDYFYEAVELTANLYYTLGQTTQSSTNFIVQGDDKHGVFMGYFDLSTIFTTHGTYSLCLQITTDNPLYQASDFTKQILFTFV